MPPVASTVLRRVALDAADMSVEVGWKMREGQK